MNTLLNFAKLFFKELFRFLQSAETSDKTIITRKNLRKIEEYE